MENQERLVRRFNVKESGCQFFFVIKVDGTLNVSTVVFILEAAVNDDELLVELVIFAIQHLNNGLFCYARKLAAGIDRGEMWQLGSVRRFNVQN